MAKEAFEHYEWQEGPEYVGLFFEPDNTTRPCRVCHTAHVGWWRVHRASDGDIESGPLSYNHYYCDVCVEDWKRAFDNDFARAEEDDEPGGEDSHLEMAYEDRFTSDMDDHLELNDHFAIYEGER